MKCASFSLIGVDGQQAGIFPLFCKRWLCPRCGPRKARQTIARIQAGMKLGDARFFTITSPGDEGAESYVLFPIRWKLLHQRIVRRFGPIEYLGVVEPQKRGAAHIHVVFRGPFIPQPWLSRAAVASGFGPITDIRRSHKRLTTYLAKYLTKQLAVGESRPDDPAAALAPRLPKYFRRVRWSRGWCVWARQRVGRDWPVWWIADTGQEQAAIDARGRGLSVVELEVADGAPPGLCFGPIVRWVRTLAQYRPFAPTLRGAATIAAEAA